MSTVRLVVLLSLAVGVAPATAGTLLVPADIPFTWGFVQFSPGPLFAGDRIVWLERDRRGKTTRLRTSDLSGTTQLVESYPAEENGLDLRASADMVAVNRAAQSCFGETACKYGALEPVLAEARVGAVGSPTTVLAGCYSRRQCQRGLAGVFGLAGAVVGVVDRDGRHLRGPGVDRDLPATFDVGGMAGDFVLSLGPRVRLGEEAVRWFEVQRVADGSVVLRVDAPAVRPVLGADGTVAFRTPSGMLEIASPAAPEPKAIAAAPDRGSGASTSYSYALRVAGGRVAVLRTTTADSGVRDDVTVYDADGGVVASAPVRTALPFDFDGRRLAWGQRPCHRVTMTVWDLEDAPVELKDGCVTPALVGGLDLVGPGRVAVTLACPAEQPAGCYGYGLLSLGTPARRLRGRPEFDLYPGERATLRFALSRAQRRLVRRHRHAPAELRILDFTSSGTTLRRHRTYRIRRDWPRWFTG